MISKSKILIVTERLSVLMISPQFRPLVGGYERSAERLSAALSQQGLNVVVVTERRNRTWPGKEFVDGYQILRLPCVYRRRLHALTSMISFLVFLLLRGRSFDVWHVHQYGLLAALAVVMGKLQRRPVVLKLTSSSAGGIGPTLGSGITGKLLRYYHKQVSACFALTDETLEEAIRFGIPKQRVHLIPNGLEKQQFYPATSEERSKAKEDLGLNFQRIVLYVGRLSLEKNPVGLLEAWAAINTKTRSGSLLVFVGDGPERNEVEAKIQKLNLSKNVFLAGNRDDVAIWYRIADIYVICSHNEGLSNTMIEAMASGLPIVSTNVSGSKVILELPVSGFVVDVDNTKQLSKAIESLLIDSSMRMQFGTNARKTFESHFSMESVVSQVNKVYIQLTGAT